MAQLSTDSLAYSQIIAMVQEFVASYIRNNNVTAKDFDDAYNQLLTKIKAFVGSPMSELDLINVGDIPSSTRFNTMIGATGSDINIITNQLDALAANYVNSFNILSDEIESEKSSLERMRSKIAALEMYSSSPSNNITYIGDLLNNMNLIDVSKTKGIQVCDVTDGVAILPKKSSTKWKARLAVYNQNYNDLNSSQNTSAFGVSNGLPGCNFLFSKGNFNNITDPFLFQKDSLTIKSDSSRMIDESPTTFFEYEALYVDKNQPSINTSQPSVNRPVHEFQYLSGNNVIDWSSFDTTKTLKLTVELTSTKSAGENVNYISIIPFFGYDDVSLNARIKNVKITSLKLYNSNTNRLFDIIQNNPVYIGGDVSGSTINNYKNYFYNKGIFRFPEVTVNKVYITFEQDSFNDVEIKNPYWIPYTSSQPGAPLWRGQQRFNPEANMPDNFVAGSTKWTKEALIPSLDRPLAIKGSSTDSIRLDLSYSVNQPSTNNRLKMTKSTDQFVYYDKKETFKTKEYYIFRAAASINLNQSSVLSVKAAIEADPDKRPCVFLGENETLATKKIDLSNISVVAGSPAVFTVSCAESHNLSLNDYIYIFGAVQSGNNYYSFDKAYQVSAVSNSITFQFQSTEAGIPSGSAAATEITCLPLYTKASSSNLSTDQVSATVPQNRTEQVFLKRNFEIIKAKRASIGIRDIFVGRELFSDKAEIISKPFYVYDDVDLISLEVADQIPNTEDSSTSIDYYISVDDGLKWIQISPIQRNFVGVPEIVAFNQNISGTARMPQIAYYNYPEIPNPIKSIRFRAVMKKDRNSNATPILGSYKLGLRFKQ